MKHIHFSVCGIGLGHASRCVPLIRESLKRGCRVTISTYGDAINYFQRLGLRVNAVPALDYGRGRLGEVSLKATMLKNVFLPLKVAAQTMIESHLIEDSGADVVLSDTRASAIFASRVTRVPNVLMLNQYRVILQKDKWPRAAAFFEDFINAFTVAWSLSDRVFLADYPPPLTISRENLHMRKADQARAEFIGPILEKLPSHYPSRDRLKEMLGINPSHPLITVIPTGPTPDRNRFVDLVLPLLPTLTEFQVIMTGVKTKNIAGDQLRNLRLVEWYEDEYELLSASDIIITRAGQTLTAKALAFGCRLVLVPIPRQTEQESNAKSLVEKRVAMVLNEREINRENLVRVVKSVYEEIDEENLKQYTRLAASTNSLQRVINELIRAAS